MKDYFRQLYDTYATDVYRYAFWLCHNTAVAQDITSETFARAWAGRERIRTETVRAYLITIARNIYLKQQKTERLLQPMAENFASRGPSPEQKVNQRLTLEEMFTTLDHVVEIDRSAFLLRMVYEMKYREIARVLNISVSNAKVKVHRVRLKLAAAQSELEGV